MKLSNVKLILLREMRDQLRDRRTLFTVAVLPVLLYPLLGMCFLQVAQFMKQHPTRVLVLGAAELPDKPVLIETVEDGSKKQFPLSLCVDEEEQSLLELTVRRNRLVPDGNEAVALAARAMATGDYEAVVLFPAHFSKHIKQFGRPKTDSRPASSEGRSEPLSNIPSHIPQPRVFFDAAKDKSRIANDRLSGVLGRRREQLVRRNLIQRDVPIEATEPFELVANDVAPERQKQAAIWSKLLPFIVLIWALTGAFYPAIDLIAGEKERGTLETLLSSPAGRSEIVCGKLLAVMIFSMATSVLNLASMGVTSTFIMQRIQGLGSASAGFAIGPPPIAAMGWLLLALVPISALFSALALAIAAMARGTKEGQYYLMPLLLITMPLIMLPMLPAAELELGNSLIPVTGMMLLLRALMEGSYGEALLYTVPVLAVTALCCFLAIRWAIDQFHNESVLFSESERFNLIAWLKHLLRDRGPTPTAAAAILCGVMLLLLRFFAVLTASMPDAWARFAGSTVITLVGLVAAPALIMTLVLTRSPRDTLLLRMPRSPLTALCATPLLAVAIHPVAMTLAQLVFKLYPLSKEAAAQLEPISQLMNAAPLWQLILVIAVVPAICEEIAFRGFILSGLRHMGHKWSAILLSSVFFGVTHGVLQQSLMAAAVGVVIGYLAVQTGSLFPCMAFHLIYNTLSLLTGRVTPELVADYPAIELFFQQIQSDETIQYVYNSSVVGLGGVCTIFLLLWLRRLPSRLTSEETLQEALQRQSAHAGVR